MKSGHKHLKEAFILLGVLFLLLLCASFLINPSESFIEALTSKMNLTEIFIIIAIVTMVAVILDKIEDKKQKEKEEKEEAIRKSLEEEKKKSN